MMCLLLHTVHDHPLFLSDYQLQSEITEFPSTVNYTLAIVFAFVVVAVALLTS